MKIVIFLCSTIFVLAPNAVSAFLSRSTGGSSTGRSCPPPSSSLKRRNRVIRYYFDDISRKSTYIPWTPDYIQQKTRRQVQEYADEKLGVLQQKLYGFDVESASGLTKEDVETETLSWMTNDSFLLDSIHEDDVQLDEYVRVCQETTVIGCYAVLWERILEFTRNDNAQLIMVVFPHCPEFYNYDTMSYIDGTIRSSYEFCSSLGGDDGHLVGLFHPRFENEPKMLSPEKHSPFPTFAIHSRNIIGDMEEQAPAEELFQADVKYEGDGELNYSSLRMKENVMELEKLFNSGASSAQNNVVGISMDSKDYVVDLTKDWIAKNSENGYNEALRYTETIEDRWIISNSDIGEEIFCDIWNTIHALHELAQKDIPEVSFMFLFFTSPL